MEAKKTNSAGDKSGMNEILVSVIEKLSSRIENSSISLNNRELIKLCQNYTETIETIDPHIYHEIAETALNLLIKRRYAGNLTARNDEPGKFVADTIKSLAERLPTQTWRSREQTLRQQFSTPPAIAYLLWHLVSCCESETIFEPSAGTGSLIVWSENPVHCNEIDSRRRELLRALGFAPTAFDAEFINDFLPLEIKFDCLLMNPPFSSNGGRTERNSSKYGFRHVESALERLKKGGKFGIILGEAAGLDTKTGRDFWSKLADRIEVKTIIKISGREYYKNGTSVDINLITGKKLTEVSKLDPNKRTSQIVCIRAESVEEAFIQAQKINLRLNH